MTFSYANLAEVSSDFQQSQIDAYELDIEFPFSGGFPDLSTFDPIPELRQQNGDISVIILTANVWYQFKVDDPLFSAHVPYNIYLGTIDHATWFGRDNPITALGCVEQHQFCTENEHSDLLGLYEFTTGSNGSPGRHLNKRQVATLNHIRSALNGSSPFLVLAGLLSADLPLLARQKQSVGISPGLPDNQWELEAEIWFSIGVAHLQRQVVAWSSRQAAPNPEDLNLTLTPEEAWLCQNQMIRGTSYQSFNVLALVLIFVSGLLISIFSMFVDDLTFYCQRKFKRSTTRREICENKDTLQLQRMLYERPGEGTWHDGSGGVPIAKRGEMLKLHRGGQTSNQQGLLQKRPSQPPSDTDESTGDSEGVSLVSLPQLGVHHRFTY